jgi:hypothetical protein
MFELTEEEAKRCAAIKNLSDGTTLRLIPTDIWNRFQIEAHIEGAKKLQAIFKGVRPYAPDNQTKNN